MIARLFLVLGSVFLMAFSKPVSQPASLESAEAARQGRALADQILSQQPTRDYTNSGVLKIRPPRSDWVEIPVKFTVIVTTTNWQNIYEASISNRLEKLFVIHTPGQSNACFFHTNYSSDVPLLGEIPIGRIRRSPALSDAELNLPFAGSDFWLGDLGLEFLRWPAQRILRTELRKTLACKVLESTNPHPNPDAYSRVVSWIDSESGGLVHADAYDAGGKVLKEFDPKTVKEVDGEPQLVKMEMYNRQTRSRSQIEFNSK